MSGGLYSHTTRAIGTVLTAAIYNADHVNHITNQNPTMTGAYSDNVGQYQSVVDPGGVGSESLAGNLAGELERLRFAIKRITGKAQWYVAPAANLDQTLNSVNPGLIALTGAIPLTLRRTENDTTERDILALESGSGAGTDALIKIKGDGANAVAEWALFVGGAERIRFPQTTLRWDAGGYLSTSNGVPIITADAVGATSIWFSPFKSNIVPVLQNGIIHMRLFAALELVLNNPNHPANTLFDVFIDDNAGVLRIGSGPAWTNSGAGTSARGSGAGTTELTRINGIWVNAVQQTARNGAGTYTLPVNAGTYVGTFLTDAAGATTLHRAWGQSRRWSIWNYWNRVPLYLKAGDSTASWSYGTNTVRAANGAAANSMVVLQGLAEQIYDIKLGQKVAWSAAANTFEARNGIGWNSTTVMSGRQGEMGNNNSTTNDGMQANLMAEFLQVPSIGRNDITALEIAPLLGGGTINWFGGEDDMVLSARWMG